MRKDRLKNRMLPTTSLEIKPRRAPHRNGARQAGRGVPELDEIPGRDTGGEMASPVRVDHDEMDAIGRLGRAASALAVGERDEGVKLARAEAPFVAAAEAHDEA